MPQAAECADLTIETPASQADTAYLFKLIPVLEAQRKGRGYELAKSLNAKFLVITYPLKSLGGREKGMAKNYAAQLENALQTGQLGRFTREAQAVIGNELVCVLGR